MRALSLRPLWLHPPAIPACALFLPFLAAALASEPVLLPLNSLDGVSPSMRPKGAEAKLSLVPDEGSAGKAVAIRLEGTSPAAPGNKYFGVNLRLPEPLDLTRRRVLLDARTAHPEDTQAFYVRFYNRGETKPAWSFYSWNGQLGTAWRTFSFQHLLSPEGLNWEAGIVESRVARRVDRIEVIIGTGGDGRPVDVFLKSLRSTEPLLTVADLRQPKPLVRDTLLVRDGRAMAAILHPDSAAGRQAAQTVAAAIQARTGTALPLRPATPADREKEPRETLILLGNVDNNPALLLPYARYLTPVDGICPGDGGYLVHTVHDPFGKGVNLAVVGASNDAGLQQAAQMFAALLDKLPQGPTLSLPRTFERGYAPPFLKRYGWAASAPSPKRLEDGLAQGRKALDEGRHCSIAGILETVALRYQLTGHAVEARLFVSLWDLYAASAVADPRKYGGPWGFDSDFPSAQVVCGWDVIEEDPALSDEERLRVTQTMARWLSEAVIPKVGQALTRVPHNHQTFPGLGALMGGLYFSHGYDVIESRNWLAIAENLFRPQASRCKPLEDCNGYQWLTNGHQMRYALARPDFTLFTSGAARQVIDSCIGTMNNLGYQVPYGDTGSWQCWTSELACLEPFAYFTGDAEATWTAAWKRQLRSSADVYSFRRTGAGERPARFDGVKVWPLEPVYYDSHPAANRPGLPSCFDKISFREALDPAAAYLLLDGLSNGGHKHLDGNSIPQLTQFGRIWLADNDYIKAQPKYHNTALIFQDGQASAIPEYAGLLGAGETERCGFSRTRLAGYSGVDWERVVVWLKELQSFLVLDRMLARESAEYQFRTLWQGVGEPEPAKDGMLLRQMGPSLRIQTAPGPRVSIQADAGLGATWRGYPFAPPVTQTMTATATLRLQPGESYLYATALHGSPDGDAAPWKLDHLAGCEGVRIQTGQGLLAVGLGPADLAIPGLELSTDAQVWIASASGLTLLQGSYATLGGKSLHRAQPGSVDLPTPKPLPLASLPVRPEPPVPPSGSEAPAHPCLWSREPDAAPLSFTRVAAAKFEAGGARGCYAGTTQGALLALGADGTPRWTRSFAAALHDLSAADLDGDGRDEAILGRQDGFLTALDDDGRELWSRPIPFYRERPEVACVRSGDLDGDGRPEVVAGAYNWRFYAFRADGSELWHYETVRKSLSGAVADLDGDGKDEILCGTEYYSTTTLRGDGTRLWSYSFGPICHQVATGSFDGDKTRGALYGGGDGCLHYLSSTGQVRLRFQTGEEVRHVAAGDLDGDGRDEILAGSQNNSVYCFGADAKLRWRRDLGAEASGLAIAGDLVVAGSGAGHLLTLDRSGNTLASSSLNSRIVQITPLGQGIAVATADGRLRLMQARPHGEAPALQSPATSRRLQP